MGTMEDLREADLWTVNEAYDWPPPYRPIGPISPTLMENLRECQIRAGFASSPEARYPRRTTPPARVGTAFHKTLELLDHGAISASAREQSEYAIESLDLFREQVANQRRISASRPRERNLPWPDDRLDRAEATLITAARAIWASRRDVTYSQAAVEDGTPTSGSEQPITSRDGLLHGKLDRAELTDNGWRIVDYKTSTTTGEERHERQIRFYAYLWFDRWGEWPAEGLLNYVLLRREIPVEIDPAECESLAAEARDWASVLATSVPLSANPGEACSYCEFRPWCRPFWRWTCMEGAQLDQRARLGLEGIIQDIRTEGNVAFIQLEGQHRAFVVRVPLERFPHIAHVGIHDHLRVLDTVLTGPYARSTAHIGDRTEIYQVSPGSSRVDNDTGSTQHV